MIKQILFKPLLCVWFKKEKKGGKNVFKKFYFKMLMNKEQILNGNKLIGEYDELKKDSYGKFFKNGVFKGYNETEFLYHKSWDWLMPVLLKMRNENYGFRIQNLTGNDFICITKANEQGEMKDIMRSDNDAIFKTYEPDSLIDDLFCVIVETIKKAKNGTA